LKVTLPLSFIYRNDIFDTIDTVFTSLFKQRKQKRGKDVPYQGFYRTSFDQPHYSCCIWGLPYYGLHKMATDVLGRNISNRDFELHLEKLVKDQELNRIEFKNSKRNIKPTYYMQTEKARMRHRLKIQHEIIGKREKAYQLLLLYCAFNDAPVLPVNYDRNILEDDESLEGFLSKEFGLSKDDFKVESIGYNHDLYRVTRFVKKTPFPNIRYQKVEYLKGPRQLGKKHEYRYILPGISIREFLRGIKRRKALEHIPQSMSELEVEECFRLLLQEDLIKQVLMFHGEPRYDLVNNDLRIFLQGCWVIYGISSITMNFIWTNVRMPTEDERKWYEKLWGKHNSDIRFNSYHESLRVKERDIKKKGYRKVSAEFESIIENWGYKALIEHFQKLNEHHSNIIQKYLPLSNILMKMVFPEFLRNLVNKNDI
jgi:hypothetical protein